MCVLDTPLWMARAFVPLGVGTRTRHQRCWIEAYAPNRSRRNVSGAGVRKAAEGRGDGSQGHGHYHCARGFLKACTQSGHRAALTDAQTTAGGRYLRHRPEGLGQPAAAVGPPRTATGPPSSTAANRPPPAERQPTSVGRQPPSMHRWSIGRRTASTQHRKRPKNWGQGCIGREGASEAAPEALRRLEEVAKAGGGHEGAVSSLLDTTPPHPPRLGGGAVGYKYH